MTNTATPTNSILPHLSSAGTIVKCYAPSPPCTPVESAQPVVTSSTEPVSVAQVVPGFLCVEYAQCLNGYSIMFNT